MLRTLFSLCLISLLVVPVAQGAVVVQMPLDDMVRNAAVIVQGNVVAASSFQDEAGGRIYTRHTVLVSNYLKGDGPERIQVVTLGGELGDIGQVVPGEARLEQGEEVVLCLHEHQRRFTVLGMAQGKFTVRTEGASKVLKREFKGLLFAGEEGMVQKRGDQLPLEALKGLIKRVNR